MHLSKLPQLMNPNVAENAGLEERELETRIYLSRPNLQKTDSTTFYSQIPVRYTEVFFTQRCMEFPVKKYLYNFSGYFLKKSPYGILILM